jgi:lipopolysaccharide/colanic/teichoic acid biosynthesis glycosyltransferase
VTFRPIAHLATPHPGSVAQGQAGARLRWHRVLVKPGITGVWQVSGRTELGVDDYVRQDILYVQNWSFALDLYILARAVPAVLSGRGAY